MSANFTLKSMAVTFQLGIRIFWVLCFSLLLFTDKIIFHKKINSFSTSFLDYVMQYLTYLGDGVFAVFLSFIILMRNTGLGIFILISYAVSALITQVLKHTFFNTFHRPYFYFKDDATFHFIQGFQYHSHHSFPSGHATTCFAIFSMLAFYFNKKPTFQLLFLFLAILIAFSRVYLSQHFLQDIIAGSMIGYFSSYFIYSLLQTKFSPLNKPVFSYFKKQN